MPLPLTPLVFVHIPKAAGTSLKALITKVYQGRPIVLFSQGDGLLERFRNLPPQRRAQCAVLGGHAPFGLQSAFDETNTNPAVITVLREPVARVVSLYRYIFREPAHPEHARFTADRPTIRDVYEQSTFAPFDNHQTRYLAGESAHAKPFGSLTPQDLATAKINLEHGCRAFGIQSRMDESLTLFQRDLNWPKAKLPAFNTSPPTSEAPAITEADREAIATNNTHDLDLYAFAVDLFERRIAGKKTKP